MSPVNSPLSSQMMIDPLQRRFRGSVKISDYEVMAEKLGEGTFGIVSKATSKRTGKIVALKKILMHNEKEGFPITALREVKLLKMLSHPNILKLEEMAVERQPADDKGKTGKKRATLYMVMPYMDHDLSGMLTNEDIHFSMPQIKCYMLQLLEGVRYLHNSHILHRDMKAANILISNRGILQIADFGLARHYDGEPPQRGRGSGVATRDYTSLVVTRWYRPPELLLTLKRYTPAIDLWGVGCIFGEMFERKPILEGKTDVDQCVRIFKLVGSPTEETMPGYQELPGCEGNKQWEPAAAEIDRRFGPKLGKEGLDLLKSLLLLDWRKRINAIDALEHEYFKVNPIPARPEDLPTYEDSHELDARRRGHEKNRALPPAPAGGTVGMGPDEQWNQSGPSYPNGYGHDRRGYSGERGLPARTYDDRRGRPPPPMVEGGRQAAWKPERDIRGPSVPTSGPLPPRPSHLPPRPDPIPSRDSAPRSNSDRDTYIPAYSHDRGPREHRPPRDDKIVRDDRPPREHDRSGRGGRETSFRDTERGHRDGDPNSGRDRTRDRDRDRDWDRNRDTRDRGYREPDMNYRDRDRDRDRERDRGRAHRDNRTRSRSPGRRENEAKKERLQNREWDLYDNSYRR